MKPDGVTIAFELISDEIQYATEGIATQGAQAFKELRYSDAETLADSGKSLQQFKQKIDALTEEWQASFDEDIRKKVIIAPTSDKPFQSKSKKTRLRIIFPDGTAFEEAIAADSFVKAIQRIGLQEVEDLKITLRKLPLVGVTKSNKYQQRRVEGKYVTIHSQTTQKKSILDEISQKLNLKIKIAIIN